MALAERDALGPPGGDEHDQLVALTPRPPDQLVMTGVRRVELADDQAAGHPVSPATTSDGARLRLVARTARHCRKPIRQSPRNSTYTIAVSASPLLRYRGM